MKILYSTSSHLYQPQLSTNDFRITIVSQSVLISGSITSSVLIEDINYASYANPIIRNTCNIYPNVIISNNNVNNFIFTSLNTDVATVDNSGSVSYVANGTAFINIFNNKRTRQVQYEVSQTSPNTFLSMTSFETNSLAYNISSSFNSMVSGLTASSSSYNMLSYIDDTHKVYQWNKNNLWCSGSDLTCIPVSRDGQQTGKGVLVSSDILITANHAGVGSKYYFLDNNNSTISASVLSSYNIPSTDLLVVRFNSNVSSSVKPAKVFNKNVFSGSGHNVSVSASITHTIPMFMTNQFRTARIGILSNSNYNVIMCYKPTAQLYSTWYSAIISGDSGNAHGVIVNNQFVATGTWYSSDLTMYSDSQYISYYFDAINNAITTLGSTNYLTTASMTGFSSY